MWVGKNIKKKKMEHVRNLNIDLISDNLVFTLNSLGVIMLLCLSRRMSLFLGDVL